MSSRDQDRHGHGNDDDRELDAFLRGEDDLAAALRGLEQPAPPPALDERIRAQAREALAEPTGAANDAGDIDEEEERALVASPLGRWRAPLAVAATVVIGVSLALQWDGGHQDTAPAALADTAPPASGPRAPESSTVPAPEAAEQQEPAPPMVEKAAPATGARERREVRTTPAEAVRPPPPPPPAPAASPAPALPAPAPVTAPAYPMQHFASPQAAEGDADGLAVQRRSAPATTHVEVTGSRAAAADERRPREWLVVIGQLLDHKLDDDARTSWANFRRDYPDYPVPEALRRRLESLPAPP